VQVPGLCLWSGDWSAYSVPPGTQCNVIFLGTIINGPTILACLLLLSSKPGGRALTKSGKAMAESTNPDATRVVDSDKGIGGIPGRRLSALTLNSMDNPDHEHEIPIRASYFRLLSQKAAVQVPTRRSLYRYVSGRRPSSPRHPQDPQKTHTRPPSFSGERLQQ
jgi:hypothetical protein